MPKRLRTARGGVRPHRYGDNCRRLCPGRGTWLPSLVLHTPPPGRMRLTAAARALLVEKVLPVSAAARGPVCAAADTAPRLDSPREPLGCQATFRPPVGAATRSNRRCALPHLAAPQGAAKEGTGAAALCPCHCLLSPPFPLSEGALRIAALQAAGRVVFCWPGCVLRPLQASPPAKPQDACLLLAGRALSTTLAALTQRYIEGDTEAKRKLVALL